MTITRSILVALLALGVALVGLSAGYGGTIWATARTHDTADHDLLHGYEERFAQMARQQDAIVAFVQQRIPELQALVAAAAEISDPVTESAEAP
jgi:uncharacterized membrane protein